MNEELGDGIMSAIDMYATVRVGTMLTAVSKCICQLLRCRLVQVHIVADIPMCLNTHVAMLCIFVATLCAGGCHSRQARRESSGHHAEWKGEQLLDPQAA